MSIYTIRRWFAHNAIIIEVAAIFLMLCVIFITFSGTSTKAEGLKPTRTDATSVATILPTTTTTMPTTSTTTIPIVNYPTTLPAQIIVSSQVATTEGNLCNLVNNYDWPHDVAYRVCMQESGGNPNNQNLNDYHSYANCRGSFGLMQINCGAKIDFFNPTTNLDTAYAMWLGSGRTFKDHWVNTCKKVGC